MANERFQVTPYRAGGCLIGYVTCSFEDLKRVFGEPEDGDGYKTSTEWVIKDTATSKVFALYDYKNTELYDPDLPSVDQFRTRATFDWHVGGECDIPAFTKWLSEKLGHSVKGRKDRLG